jgi:hypothetical protein
MSLLHRVLFKWKCGGTHHKLALDALRQLRGPDADDWRNLCLWHIDPYLRGATDPDVKFRDFRNHVLHVQENCWGGAIAAAQCWYGRLVLAARNKKWASAAYCAGVLGHYCTDPLQPFHTAQSEEEGAIHQALEWSVAQSYDELHELLESQLGGHPRVDVPEGDDWLSQLLKGGAALANGHYQALIDHYHFAKAVKDPRSGLDQELRQRIALLLGHAAAMLAHVLDRAFAEAGIAPPKTDVRLPGLLAWMTIPIFWASRKLPAARQRLVVERMYREYRDTGRVLETLSADDRAIREMHAAEVLKISLDELNKRRPRTCGTKHGQEEAPAPRRPAATSLPAVTASRAKAIERRQALAGGKAQRREAAR